MERKVTELINEMECVIEGPIGKINVITTVEKIKEAQERLKKLFDWPSTCLMTLREIFELETRNWPEEDRIRFFEHFDACEGWAVNHKTDDIKLDLIHTKTEDGKFLIRWNLKDD